MTERSGMGKGKRNGKGSPSRRLTRSEERDLKRRLLDLGDFPARHEVMALSIEFNISYPAIRRRVAENGQKIEWCQVRRDELAERYEEEARRYRNKADEFRRKAEVCEKMARQHRMQEKVKS